LAITDIVIESPPTANEFQPILWLLSQLGSLPVTEVSFELVLVWPEDLNQVPWDRLWDVLEKHCAQLEKLSFHFSLRRSYRRRKMSAAEKEKMEVIVKDALRVGAGNAFWGKIDFGTGL
jgi:hypothetical protein